MQNQNNLNNSYNSSELRAARNRALARVSGLPSRGLPLNSSRLALETSPRKTRRAPSAEALGLTLNESDGKLVVESVRDDSVMAQVGFKAGDQIETVNGKIVHSRDEFQLALGNLTVGQEVNIVIVRQEQSDTLKWTPTAEDLTSIDNEAADVNLPVDDEPSEINFIAAAQLARSQRGQAFLGVRVDPTKSKEVIVQTVLAGSPAQKAGLRPGDRIYALSGVTLEAPKDLGELLVRNAPGSAVYLYVGRAVAPPPAQTTQFPTTDRACPPKGRRWRMFPGRPNRLRRRPKFCHRVRARNNSPRLWQRA